MMVWYARWGDREGSVRDQRLKPDDSAPDGAAGIPPYCGSRSTECTKADNHVPSARNRVIASGAVGARHQEMNFLQIHIIPRKTHLHRPNHHDAPAITAELQGLLAGAADSASAATNAHPHPGRW